MESRPVTCSRSFLVAVIAAIVIVSGAGIYFILVQPQVQPLSGNSSTITLTSNIPSNMTENDGHISGVMSGPVVINITELP